MSTYFSKNTTNYIAFANSNIKFSVTMQGCSHRIFCCRKGRIMFSKNSFKNDHIFLISISMQVDNTKIY